MSMFTYLLWFDELQSTQAHIKERSYPYGTVVVAKKQTSGRGRLGRVWASQEGGLYFSFLIEDQRGIDISPFPLVLGYSLLKALANLGIDTKIKWPNDLYAMGRKMAGILVERTGKGIVVGVGINVNQDSFPQDISHRAISMRIITGKTFSLKQVLLKVLDSFSEDIETFLKESFGVFKDKIENNLLYRGSRVLLISEREETEGILEGIDLQGRLILNTPKGRLKLVSGELSLRGA